jgi:hypothetical protein
MTEFFSRTLANLRQGPLGPLVHWIEAHPRLTAWFVLALGMVIMLVIEARHIGLLPGQWAALIIATILVAGACIWIISWEDDDQLEGQEDAAASQPAPAAPAKVEDAAEQPAAAAFTESEAAPKKRTRKAPSKRKS